ncbi:Uncharacterized protein Rs2_06229 [Raphanus sativus]|uniref:Uncharacterized protein LOC108842981 n=1 Tax=Raphanus sativus TaxID=3726 RepID=A0A6J0MI14_RAPSA|nr:uncharacterized protein LOC108842981 [Raphanus sativus]KAJ4911608.1 Uncharacterized protein Rs2_06229 [Raphanus sativus]
MGGEDNTIGFMSFKLTLVFWNIDDYPIPVDKFDAIMGDIPKALSIMGFRDGFMSVWLYSEQLNYDKRELCEAEVISTYSSPNGGSESAIHCKVPSMTFYMIRYASMTGPGPVNLFVIAKPERELNRVLQCLKSRRHNVLIVKPPPPGEEFIFSLDSLLENSRFLGGGKPRRKELYSHFAEEYDDYQERFVKIKQDVSKTVDFSERIPTVRGGRTAVFWDAVDCPFPPSFTPDEIYRSIKSALVAKQFSKKNITIWAYLDDDDDDKKGSSRDALLRGDKTWASRIYFLPAGDKAARRIRMLNDMYLWERDTRCTGTSLVLFADHFKDDAYYTHMLELLHDMRYDVIFVTPTPDISNPDTPEWPLLLLDKGAAWFADDDETSQMHHEAEQETPEKLPITSDIRVDDLTSESSQDSEPEEMQTDEFNFDTSGLLIEEGPAWENDAVEEDSPDDLPVYRWDPAIRMYRLKSMFPKKKHQPQAAPDEETPQKLATHGH